MITNLKILSPQLLAEYKTSVTANIDAILNKLKKESIPADYFQFYNAVSSVYSSKIEGEDIEFDSFFKHKFMNIKFEPNYTQRADDLVKAYEFSFENKLNLSNLLKAHSLLSQHLLPKSQRGLMRNNPMFVLNSEDRIEYVAAEPNIVKQELDKLFEDINVLRNKELETIEVFYYAAFIHLVFVKIHPLQDGNGRTARLLEKWFLFEKLGDKAVAVGLEKNYFTHRTQYYATIKNLGIEYEKLNYSNSLDFLKMTITGLINQL